MDEITKVTYIDGRDNSIMKTEYVTDSGRQFPIDRNHPEDSKQAVEVPWPTGLSKRGEKVLRYFDGAAFLFKYKGEYIITDESGDLTEAGDGVNEPWGGPRFSSRNYKDVKTWIEEIGQEFDDAEAAGEEIPGWDETPEETEW